jgi:hypothetical protein
MSNTVRSPSHPDWVVGRLSDGRIVAAERALLRPPGPSRQWQTGDGEWAVWTEALLQETLATGTARVITLDGRRLRAGETV